MAKINFGKLINNAMSLAQGERPLNSTLNALNSNCLNKGKDYDDGDGDSDDADKGDDDDDNDGDGGDNQASDLGKRVNQMKENIAHQLKSVLETGASLFDVLETA